MNGIDLVDKFCKLKFSFTYALAITISAFNKNGSEYISTRKSAIPNSGTKADYGKADGCIILLGQFFCLRSKHSRIHADTLPAKIKAYSYRPYPHHVYLLTTGANYV